MPFAPTDPPAFSNVQDLQDWVVKELQRLASDLTETEALELRQRGDAPLKPREGMIVAANGTSWNPGAGAGAYEYRGGAWVKL